MSKRKARQQKRAATVEAARQQRKRVAVIALLLCPSLAGGTAYLYRACAVDALGNRSGYSNVDSPLRAKPDAALGVLNLPVSAYTEPALSSAIAVSAVNFRELRQ